MVWGKAQADFFEIQGDIAKSECVRIEEAVAKGSRPEAASANRPTAQPPIRPRNSPDGPVPVCGVAS